MQAYVYKSRRKSETYVYLRERDGFGLIPEPLRVSLGGLDFVLEIALDAQRKLAREDPAVVLANLVARGFHLQFPPRLEGAQPAPIIEYPSDMSALTPPPAPPVVPPSPAFGERGTSASLRDRLFMGDLTHGDA
jgi:uncharacterized protein YcgL (UPF0745 family)